ncbi:MAG: anti-sigma factor [Actinobacteria bacterium]|nr:anti-sigma factor [Actinomycetota bacterium]
MNPNPDLHHLGAAYALDALDDVERAAYESHYPTCEICSQEVLDFRSTTAALSEVSTTAPSAELKASVMQLISATRQLPPVTGRFAPEPKRRGTALWAAAAALLLFVASAAFLVGRAAETDDAFASQLEHVLAQPDVRMLDLPATSAATAGHLRVIWSASSNQIAILGDELPPADVGTAYELWLIDETGPVPTRMLDSAENGVVRRILPLAGTPDTWGVTIEPQQGSTSPTGEILFLGDA